MLSSDRGQCVVRGWDQDPAQRFSRRDTRSRLYYEQHVEEIDRRIEELLEECEKIDEMEQGQIGHIKRNLETDGFLIAGAQRRQLRDFLACDLFQPGPNDHALGGIGID